MGVEEKLNFDTKEDFHRTMRHLRYDWDNKIPSKIYCSTTKINGREDAPKRFKARTTWFNNVIGSLDVGIMCGYLPESFKSRFSEPFHAYLDERNLRRKLKIEGGSVTLGPKKLTEKMDIDYGNNVLDIILNELSYDNNNVFSRFCSIFNGGMLAYNKLILDSSLLVEKSMKAYSPVLA